jgi:hypothetical protein
MIPYHRKKILQILKLKVNDENCPCPNGQPLKSYLNHMYGLDAGAIDDQIDWSSSDLQQIMDSSTHLLWSSFVYDYFGLIRDYSIIPKASNQILETASFSLKNRGSDTMSYFNKLLFGKSLQTFDLSNIIIGTDSGYRYFEYESDFHLADMLRYQLVEYEYLFIDRSTIDKFGAYWVDIMNRDTSTLSEFFTNAMIKMLSETYIPFNTYYSPAHKDKWVYYSKDINLSEVWNRATLINIHEKTSSVPDFIHYKLHRGNLHERYYELQIDLLKYFTNNQSRFLQRAWMMSKLTAKKIYIFLDTF